MANWVADFLERETVGEIVKRHTHSIHTRQPNGEVRADFTGAPSHWLDTDGLYKPLDTRLIAVPGGMFGAPGLQPKLTDYRLVEAGTHAHLTAWVGVYNPVLSTFAEIDTLTSGLVFGDSLISETGIFRGSLRLTETGMRDELVIQSNPNVGANANEWFVIESLIDGIVFEEGAEVFEFDNSGYHFPLPRAWDADGNQAPCTRWASTRNGMQSLYTGVPATWLATAAYPVTIDPDFAGDAADGQVYGFNATYSTARSTSYSVDSTGTYFSIGQLTGYAIFRGYLKFNTSSIPDTDIVSQVNLKMVCTQDFSDADINIVIKKQNWSDPLSSGNMETAYDGCLAATSDDNIWRNTSGIATNTQYASGNLSTAWINKTGSTYYSLISSNDVSNNAPTVSESLRMGSQNNSTVEYRPVLTVLYSAASAASGNFFLMF
jgi:hypothetical protein